MANNHVYVFRKSQPAKYAFMAECRWESLQGSAHGEPGCRCVQMRADAYGLGDTLFAGL